MIHLIDSLIPSNNESKLVGKYQDRIPIYHVNSIYELNRLIGYAKYKNSSDGTILYRGEKRLHEHLLPSGARPGKNAISSSVIEEICKHDYMRRSMGLDNEEISQWSLFQRIIVQSVLQHYGALTNSMDFVDNHWCSLWFGLYKYINNRFVLRDDDDENMYLFLYLADTNGCNIRGVYFGEDTYVVDLRRALSSLYQRPAAQHGWIVSKKECISDKSLDDRIIGVLELNVGMAKKWLGFGELVSANNFFPSMLIDQGYRTLLLCQKRSGYASDSEKKQVIPQNTIKNYHLYDCFYCSDIEAIPPILALVKDSKGNEIIELIDLFKILLDSGWNEKNNYDTIKWKECNPATGQSLPTALLIQKLFGGEIHSFKISKRDHYYNVVNDVIIDLTASEVHEFREKRTILRFIRDSWKHNIEKLNEKGSKRLNELITDSKIKIYIP